MFLLPISTNKTCCFFFLSQRTKHVVSSSIFNEQNMLFLLPILTKFMLHIRFQWNIIFMYIFSIVSFLYISITDHAIYIIKYTAKHYSLARRNYIANNLQNSQVEVWFCALRNTPVNLAKVYYLESFAIHFKILINQVRSKYFAVGNAIVIEYCPIVIN